MMNIGNGLQSRQRVEIKHCLFHCLDGAHSEHVF